MVRADISSPWPSPFVSSQPHRRLFFVHRHHPHRQIVFGGEGFQRILFRLKQLLRIAFLSLASPRCLFAFVFAPKSGRRVLLASFIVAVVVFNIFFGCLSARLIFALDFYMIIMYFSVFFFMIIFSRLYITANITRVAALLLILIMFLLSRFAASEAIFYERNFSC